MCKIPCILFRGGTSKGPFFLKSDLPEMPTERDKMLLRLMGSPDARQIDGIGGGDSLSSKAVIVSVSDRPEADVNYLLCQVHLDKAIVDTRLNCGNMLSAVAPFAIEKGLIKTSSDETTVRIYNENTNVIVHATVQTPGGVLTYKGDTAIDGVKGTAASIKLGFLNAVGSKTGKLLPTTQIVDLIDGVLVSCIDVAVPMVILSAESLQKTGYETTSDLNKDKEFLEKLENIRRQAALKMGLGDVSDSICPKICMVSKARKGGTINSRYFTPKDCHVAHAVSGALCLAAACLVEGSVASDIAYRQSQDKHVFTQIVTIEHPCGIIKTSLHVEKKSGVIDFPVASFVRTARPLFQGEVILPS